MEFKIYKAQVTGSGYLPQGSCLAVLELDEAYNPTWSDMTDEFQQICLPWFESSVRMGALEIKALKPYSPEALDHLRKRQLPSQGYVMVATTPTPPPVSPAPTAVPPSDKPSPVVAMPSPYGYAPGVYLPPPGLYSSPNSPASAKE